MPELNVQQKVIAFVQQNPQYEGKSAESVLSAMLASGEITQTEIDNLKSNNKNSTFGFGFETDYPLDLALEKPYSEHGEISTTPTTQTQKRTVDFVQKRYEKAQTDFDKQMLEDGWAADVADKFSVIWGSDNRAKKVRKDLEIANLQAEQLKIAAEESSDAFKAKFKEIYGIEYNAQNIEAFERDEKAYLEALAAKNKEDAFNQYFEKLLNEDLEDEFKTVGGGNSGATQTIKIPKEEIYEQEFKKLAEMFGEGGEEFLNEYIKQAQAEDFAVDGFSAGTGTVEYKWNLLKKLAQGMSNRFATETAKACNGSDIEALEKRYENSYKSAFGNNNDIQKRVNDYNISQQKGAGVVKMVALSVAMIAISIATMGTGTAASVPAVAGATATAGTASSAAASGSVLLSIAKSAVTVASLSAGIEISDRFSSGAALKSLREEGVLEYLETASQMTDWSQVAKASVSAGAMCVVFGGVSYAVSNLTRVAGTALKMSELGIAYASATTTSASTVATGLGVEYLMTGEISVEGVIFTVTMAVIGGVTQVMQIKKAAPQFEQAREQLKTDGEIALKILDFQPGEEVTLETIKAHTAERAMKFVSSSNSTPEKQYMQLQFIQASHDLLTANIVEIQNLLKTGGINLAVAQQNFTYNYSPSTTQTYPQISAPQVGLATSQNQVSLATPQTPSIAIQTGVGGVGQVAPAVAGLGYGIAQNINTNVGKNLPIADNTEVISQTVQTKNNPVSQKTQQKVSITEAEVNKRLKALKEEYKNNHNKLSDHDINKLTKTLDLADAEIHLKNLEMLLLYDSNRVGCAVSNGYFSSSEGAEALDFALRTFDKKMYGCTISSLDSVLTSLKPEETLKIRDRKLYNPEKSNNSISSERRNLAKLTDDEYERYLASNQDKLIYVSADEDINKLLLLIEENKAKWASSNINLARNLDDIIQKEISANPEQKSEIISFYTKLLESTSYEADKIINIISNPEKIDVYKKAITYINENGMSDAKIAIVSNTNKSNYYAVGGIADIWGSIEQKAWNVAIFNEKGEFIRFSSANNDDLIVSESVHTTNSSQTYNATLEKSTKRDIIKESAKDVFDEDGNLLYTERYVKSDVVENKYDIYREFPNGESYKIGLAEVSESGNVTIEKTFVTRSGIKTDYNYLETPDGSKLSYTRITDAEGNVTFENKYKYQVIDENHFKTTENGVEYDIQYKDGFLGNYVEVISSEGKRVRLNIGSNSEHSISVLSEDLLPLLKDMPGSFYFDIKEHGLRKIGLGINNVEKDNAHYNNEKNLISISHEWQDADFTLAHEFGHYRDYFKGISENSEVAEIYLKEREAFMANESQFETHSMHYLIDGYCRKTENYLGSLGEMVAEINAFLYSSNSNPSLELRGQFLQEYFPETFAKIASMLQDSSLENQNITMRGISNAKAPETSSKTGFWDRLENFFKPAKVETKPKWTPEKAIKAIEDMCPAGDSKNYFLNVEAKTFIDAIPNLDMANMDLYLDVIKTAIDYNINAKSSIVNNGYLSSKEGAETFLKLKKMFPYDAKRARDFLRQELDHVIASIEAKNFQSALDRDLFKKYGDDYNKINRVAGYTEKQYAQMAEFEAQGIGYISDNDEINRILLAYGQKVELPYLLEKFSNDLIKTFENDEVALKSAIDKLISYDNHKVVSTFNEVQDKKFALDNMDDLILFEQRLTSALDEAKLPSLDSPWVSFYEIEACYRNESIKTLLEIFKSGRFSDLEVAKIALKAKTGNAEHLDFISKLTKSDLDNETIVDLIEKICMPTYDRTIASMDAWYEAEEYPLKLDLYNALKAIDTKTKQVLKSCGYDADAVLKDLSAMFDRTVTVSDVSVANQRNYVQNVLSNNNPTAEKVFKNFDFSQFGEQGLSLKYTRADFNSNVENILSTLSNEEQNMLLQHFGLKRGVVGFEGLPSNKPFEGNGSAQVMQAATKIQQEIENFTLKNEVMINDPEAKAVFDALIQGFPEFTSIVGKVQHGTHAYTVDIHTLKVLQDVMNDPYYNRLSDTDKTVVKFAVLMHDFGKRGGIVDTGHATLSTDYASSILERYPFSNELKQRITDTVKLHHWFEAYNKGNATAMDVAINCRNNADYYIMRMFAKADLGNVNPTFHLGKISQGATNQAEFDAFFERQMKPIYDARMQINSKSSPIYTSRFVKNGDMFSRETAVVNGQAREYRVLNLSQLSAGEDMQKYGFAPGTTKENFAMLSHMTEDNSASLESVIRVMLDPNKDSSWSLSLFNDEYNQFYGDRRCGIIVDTELKNIVDASRENMHSGTKKNTADAVISFDAALRFNRDPQSKTVFLNSLRKNGVKLNDYEYAEVIDALLDNKWQSQNNKDIVLSNGRVLKVNDLQQALDDVRDNIIGSNQNEVVARNPIPSALMYRAKSLSECPAWFLELADKYNLPIVLK